MNWLYVFIGGGIGSMVRFAFSWMFVKLSWAGLAWATLCANVVSCIVFALAVLWYGDRETFMISYRPLIITGFCGGLSTFSTFSFETFELFKRGDHLFASANILLNTLLCLAVFYVFLAKR